MLPYLGAVHKLHRAIGLTKYGPSCMHPTAAYLPSPITSARYVVFWQHAVFRQHARCLSNIVCPDTRHVGFPVAVLPCWPQLHRGSTTALKCLLEWVEFGITLELLAEVGLFVKIFEAMVCQAVGCDGASMHC